MIDEDDVALAWNRNAPHWITQVRQGRDTLREKLNNPAFFDQFLPDIAGHDVIDLGCGEGRNTRILAQRGARVTGVDISSRMISAAREMEDSERLGIRYEVSSFSSLEMFADNIFSTAVSTMALMESPHFDRAAKEAYRILRPGGFLYFSVLHPCYWTLGSRWHFNEQGLDVGILVTDYWIEHSYVEVGRFSFVGDEEKAQAFSIPRFPYRLETYINLLCDAGFSITRVLEPRPSIGVSKEAPNLLGPIHRHAPVSIFFAASKG
jgi:SAM-dependent methyltransferase